MTGLLKRENELSAGLCPSLHRRRRLLIYRLVLSLVVEIRQLDGERQSLVYNHHHELIAASDTIRAVGPGLQGRRGKNLTPIHSQMKSRAESLDADLDKLKVAFSEISRLASDVAVTEHLSKDNSDEPTVSQSGQDAQ